jgi:hypothetical protein
VSEHGSRLHDLVTDIVSTVDWPDVGRIRSRARRRRATRVVGGGLAAVTAVAALVWSVGPSWTDAAPPGPADPRPTGSPEPSRPWNRYLEPAPELLRGEDVGPGYGVYAWSVFGDTDGGKNTWEVATLWPPAELDSCPTRTVGTPHAFQTHTSGAGIRADPEPGVDGASVEELMLRYADEATATLVLTDARRFADDCASFTAGRGRYTLAVTAEGFAGDESVQVDVTEEPAGAPAGKAATHRFLFVRIGAAVILVTPTLTADAEWLREVARSAVDRYCSVTGTC